MTPAFFNRSIACAVDFFRFTTEGTTDLCTFEVVKSRRIDVLSSAAGSMHAYMSVG